jgi:hypothetical protein
MIYRREAAGEISRPHRRVLKQRGNVSGALGKSVRLTFEPLVQHGCRKPDCREILTDLVVEISSNALLFALTDGDDLLFQLLSPLQQLEPSANIIPLPLNAHPANITTLKNINRIIASQTRNHSIVYWCPEALSAHHQEAVLRTEMTTASFMSPNQTITTIGME